MYFLVATPRRVGSTSSSKEEIYKHGTRGKSTWNQLRGKGTKTMLRLKCLQTWEDHYQQELLVPTGSLDVQGRLLPRSPSSLQTPPSSRGGFRMTGTRAIGEVSELQHLRHLRTTVAASSGLQIGARATEPQDLLPK